MSALLPTPGTIWVDRHGRSFRAVLVDHSEITLHNCEIGMRDRYDELTSWSGPIHRFMCNFSPDPNWKNYPLTAQ